jgi:sigma-B regulation protein RsbU (phosphoserine phosphatase)
VVLYTDGITEAMNAQGEEWGLERLIEALRQAPPGDANAILNHVRTAVMTFVGDTPPYDDMTMVLLRMKPGATPSPVLDASSSGEPAAQTT